MAGSDRLRPAASSSGIYNFPSLLFGAQAEPGQKICVPKQKLGNEYLGIGNFGGGPGLAYSLR
jgi:hypothetical protein